jgi:hypothetical protein
MRRGERASKRSSSRSIDADNCGNRVEIGHRQIQRLVSAFRAIKSVRLRRTIVSFAETVALAKTFRRHKRGDD